MKKILALVLAMIMVFALAACGQQAAPAAASYQDKIQMLKELAELKAQGILTEEEFAAQKKQILG